MIDEALVSEYGVKIRAKFDSKSIATAEIPVKQIQRLASLPQIKYIVGGTTQTYHLDNIENGVYILQIKGDNTAETLQLLKR